MGDPTLFTTRVKLTDYSSHHPHCICHLSFYLTPRDADRLIHRTKTRPNFGCLHRETVWVKVDLGIWKIMQKGIRSGCLF